MNPDVARRLGALALAISRAPSPVDALLSENVPFHPPALDRDPLDRSRVLPLPDLDANPSTRGRPLNPNVL